MIKTFDYLRQLNNIEDEVMDAVRRVLHSGQLILGPETAAFERGLAAAVGADFCVGVSSGTTALHLALLALDIGPGDEVITVANTCAPTVAAIELTGATPVFVDVNEDDLMMNVDLVKIAITDRTRCIVPVHLWGQSVALEPLIDGASAAGIPVLEDCAQALGTRYHGQQVGTFGVAGCFSFYPTKNLGAYGDAGAIVTNDPQLAERLVRKRMYGYERSNYAVEPGMNARISEIQSAILRVKLSHLSGWQERRNTIARQYDKGIRAPGIRLPHHHPDRDHAYHQYVIRCEDRDRVINVLGQASIDYGIHYPTPLHQMPAYSDLPHAALPVTEQASREILSIPVHEALTDAEVGTVIETLNRLAD